jgi:hypothetical protein
MHSESRRSSRCCNLLPARAEDFVYNLVFMLVKLRPRCRVGRVPTPRKTGNTLQAAVFQGAAGLVCRDCADDGDLVASCPDARMHNETSLSVYSPEIAATTRTRTRQLVPCPPDEVQMDLFGGDNPHTDARFYKAPNQAVTGLVPAESMHAAGPGQVTPTPLVTPKHIEGCPQQ